MWYRERSGSGGGLASRWAILPVQQRHSARARGTMRREEFGHTPDTDRGGLYRGPTASITVPRDRHPGAALKRTECRHGEFANVRHDAPGFRLLERERLAVPRLLGRQPA